MIAPPAGFVSRVVDGVSIVAPSGLAGDLLEAGLARPWELVQPTARGAGTGRGPRGLFGPGEPPRWLVKQCLRGGLLARINRERYVSPSRFRRELDVSRRAVAAHCPVVPTIAVAFAAARPGYRAWSVSEFQSASIDLAHALAAAPPSADGDERLVAAVRAIREMHDGGLFHGDLNLGNLLLTSSKEVLVVDLDRARFFEGGVPRRLRDSAARRLRRSSRKLLPSAPDDWIADL